MVAREARGSAIVGIPLGVVTAFIGWWAVAVSVALMGDAANTLAQPQYPAGPRLMLAGAAMATCAVAIWSRPAAVAMAAMAVAVIGYSWLVFAELAPAVVLPGGHAGSDVMRDALRAIVVGGSSIPLLLAGGLWMAIALWWLTRRGGPSAGAPRFVIGFALGIGVGVVAWWALPVVGRAMTIMFSQGRESFSVLPSVLVLGLAAASALVIMRWPALGLGAATAAIGFVAFSLAADDPATDGFLVHGYMDWWSVRLADVEEGIRSAAFRPGTIELAGAWTAMAAAHLLPLRPASRPRPVPHPLAR